MSVMPGKKYAPRVTAAPTIAAPTSVVRTPIVAATDYVRAYPQLIASYVNAPLVALGTGMLWFGWYGFNAGSEMRVQLRVANQFRRIDLAQQRLEVEPHLGLRVEADHREPAPHRAAFHRFQQEGMRLVFGDTEKGGDRCQQVGADRLHHRHQAGGLGET